MRSERSASSSTRARTRSTSGVIDGRQLGSRLIRARSRAASMSRRTVSAPGSSAAAMEPVCTASEVSAMRSRSSSDSGGSQVSANSYSAEPFSARMASAVEVG